MGSIGDLAGNWHARLALLLPPGQRLAVSLVFRPIEPESRHTHTHACRQLLSRLNHCLVQNTLGSRLWHGGWSCVCFSHNVRDGMLLWCCGDTICAPWCCGAVVTQSVHRGAVVLGYSKSAMWDLRVHNRTRTSLKSATWCLRLRLAPPAPAGLLRAGEPLCCGCARSFMLLDSVRNLSA
eukprot:scaffold21900_cov18-Tisochrysis_lutea.AAC.1